MCNEFVLLYKSGGNTWFMSSLNLLQAVAILLQTQYSKNILLFIFSSKGGAV